MNPKFKTYVNKVEAMRKLQREYFKCNSSTQKAGLLRECNKIERQVDELSIEMHALVNVEQATIQFK